MILNRQGAKIAKEGKKSDCLIDLINLVKGKRPADLFVHCFPKNAFLGDLGALAVKKQTQKPPRVARKAARSGWRKSS